MTFTKCFAFVCCAALASAQIPLKDPTLDKVIVVVDGHDVTESDIKKMLETGDPRLQQMFQQDPVSAIMQYYIMRALGEEGEKRQLFNRTPYKEQIENRRLDILAGAVINDERDGYPVPTEAIQDYYDQHRADYEQATMKAIFITFKPEGQATTNNLQAAAQEALGQARSNRSEAEARKLAEDIVKRARAGEDFVTLVETYSEDLPSKRDKGNFGVLKTGTSHPADFRKAVMALQAGEVSDPIRQATGFYIIRVEDRGLQPINAVRADIIQTIRQEHLVSWFDQINKRFQPVVKDPAALLSPQTMQQQGPGVKLPPAQ